MVGRSRSLQIYMKPGVKEDDLMLRVWDACRRLDRPQDVFRSMLRAGLMAMLESGEMPDPVVEDCGLDSLLERRRRRRRAQELPPQPVYAPPYPYALPAHGHPPPQHWPPPGQPRPQPPERAPEASSKAAAGESAAPPEYSGAHAAETQPPKPREREGGKKQGKGRIGNLM